MSNCNHQEVKTWLTALNNVTNMDIPNVTQN